MKQSLNNSAIIANGPSRPSGLVCLNSDGTVNSGVTSYDPTSGTGARKFRIELTVNGSPILADFNMRSVAYAVNAESLNGKSDTDFVKTSSNITQTNVENWFASTAFANLLAGTYNASSATTATSATTAGNVTGTVAIANGGTGATSASGAKTNLGLVAIASSGSASDLTTGTVPSARLGSGTADTTTYLRGDGTWATINTSGAVTSVAGRTGVVTLSNTDISGLGTASTKDFPSSGNAAAAQVVLGNDSRLTDGRAPTGSAGGDLSGSYPNPSVSKVQGVNYVSTSPQDGQVYIYNNTNTRFQPEYFGVDDLKTTLGVSQFATSCSSSQTLTWSAVTDAFACSNIAGLPASSISSGVIAAARLGTGTADNTTYLRGDGTWATVAAGGGTVTSVTAAATAGNPITMGGSASAPTIDLPKATTSTSGYLSAADWNTFNGKLSSITSGNVTTALGYTPQTQNSELTALAGMATTGILQRTGAGSYTALGVATPLAVSGGNIGLSISSTGGLENSSGSLAAKVGSGLTINGSNQIIPDFATTATAGKVVEANDARLPASSCASGNFNRWNGSAWVCDADQSGGSGGGNNSMITGWPDAIKCNVTSPNLGIIVMRIEYYNYPGDSKTYYRASVGGSNVGAGVIFQTSNSTQIGYETIAASDCDGKTISQLYSEGKAFDFAKGPAAQWLQTGSDAYYNAGNVGVGTSTPNSTLQVAGSLSTGIATKTTSYTLGNGDQVVLGDATSSALTITLPTAVSLGGRHYTVKKTDSSTNKVTVTTTSSQTIDGATSVALDSQYNYVSLISDGSNWNIIGKSLSPRPVNSWNSSDKSANINLSNFSLTASSSAAAWASVRATTGKSSGKWYYELTVNSIVGNVYVMVGVMTSAATLENFVGADAYGWSYYGQNGTKYNSNSAPAYGATYTAGDVVGIAFDVSLGSITFYKNGVSQGVAYSGLTGNTWYPAVGLYSGAVVTANFGDSEFQYQVPSGYSRIDALK